MDKAIKLLTALQSSGIGSQTENGFGQFEICHRIHCIGVKKHEKLRTHYNYNKQHGK